MKICFLVSGNGGNLKFFDLLLKKSILGNIDLQVIADRYCGAFSYAIKNNIKNKLIDYTVDKPNDLIQTLNEFNPDLIITNWHKIIDENTVNMWKGKMINLHYSLLPAFGGLIGTKPIEEAFKKNCQYIGATTHFVEKDVDAGEIICQTIIKKESLQLEKIINLTFRRGCLILLNSVILLSGRQDLIENKEIESIEFSPNLKFDYSILDEDFWKELSQL